MQNESGYESPKWMGKCPHCGSWNSFAEFTPVEEPFTCEQAMCEAGRCLQCDLRLRLTKTKLWNEY